MHTHLTAPALEQPDYFREVWRIEGVEPHQMLIREKEPKSSMFACDLKYLFCWYPMMGNYVACYRAAIQTIAYFRNHEWEFLCLKPKLRWKEPMTLDLAQWLLSQGACPDTIGELGMSGREYAKMHMPNHECSLIYAKLGKNEKTI